LVAIFIVAALIVGYWDNIKNHLTNGRVQPLRPIRS